MSSTIPQGGASASRATEGRGRYAVTVGGFVVVVVLAGTLVALSRWPTLPGVVASHWGPSGVDATQSKMAFTVSMGGLGLGLGLFLGVLGWFLPAEPRRILAALVGLSTGFIGIVGYGALLAQARLSDPSRATIPALTVLVGVVVSLLAAVVLWRLNPPPPVIRRGAGEPLSPGAATVPAAATERVVWLGHASPSTGLTVSMVVLLGAVAVVSGIANPWAAIPALVIGALILLLLHARVVIDEFGVRVTSAGIPWLRVRLAEIRDADHRDIVPLRDFGGLGMRYRSDRRGWVIRTGDALELHQADGTSTFVSLDHADQAAAVVNTLVARLPH